MRSEPGLGRIVRIYSWSFGMYVGDPDTWHHGIGEDYASPMNDETGIVVKLAVGVSKADAAARLRELADELEASGDFFFMEIDPDKTRLPDLPSTDHPIPDGMPF